MTRRSINIKLFETKSLSKKLCGAKSLSKKLEVQSIHTGIALDFLICVSTSLGEGVKQVAYLDISKISIDCIRSL